VVSQVRRAGHQFAEFNVGVMYEIGQGVPQDYVLAHMWFNRAAVQNHIDAIKNRDLVSAKMTPAQIQDAWRQAREWKPSRRNRSGTLPAPGDASPNRPRPSTAELSSRDNTKNPTGFARSANVTHPPLS
jgi:TPR repeat protein